MQGNQPVPPIAPLAREETNEADNDQEANGVNDGEVNEPNDEEERNENVHENSDTDSKPILVATEMDPDDVNAINDLNADVGAVDLTVHLDEDGDALELDAANDNHSESSSEANGTGADNGDLSDNENNPGEHQIEVKKTEVLDDDIEITYVEGQVLLPTVESTPMIPKLNDVLSGNIPFQGILDRDDVSIVKRRKKLVVFLLILTFLQLTVSFF